MISYSCCSVANSCLTLQLCGLQHTRLPVLHHLPEFAQTHVRCVSDAIQPSHPLPPLLLLLQSFPASGSFPMSWLLTSGGQSIGTSASASVLPVNTQGWFPLGLTGLISWQSKGLSRVFFKIWKHKFFSIQLSLWSNSHICTWKNHSFDYMDLCQEVMSLLFNMLSRLVIAFLLRGKHLLISWLQSPSAMIWEPKKKICQRFHFFPFYLPWSDGTRCHYLSFLNIEF